MLQFVRNTMLSILAATMAVGFALPDQASSADYPTPRSLAARRAPVAPSEVEPEAAAEEPRSSPLDVTAPRRPKIVRVDAPAPLAPERPIIVSRSAYPQVPSQEPPAAAPLELPSSSLIMPTPRKIARPKPYAGPRVEPQEMAPARPTSHEVDEPNELDANPTAKPAPPNQPVADPEQAIPAAAADSTSLKVVTKDASAGRSLPRVRVTSNETPSLDRFATRQVGTALQPEPIRGSFDPTKADIQRWFTPLNQVGILPQGEPGVFPKDFSKDLFAVDEVPRRKDWPEREFAWEAPEVWHQPFYFDDVPLERYGQSIAPKRQAWISGLRFYMTIPLMPVKLWTDPPFTKVATFGYYRVGDANPAVQQRSRLPHGFGLHGYGFARAAGSFWEVPPLPAWQTTPQ